MTNDTDPDVSLTDSASPETVETPDTVTDALTSPVTVKRALQARVLKPYGIPGSVVILCLSIYIILGLLIAVLLSPLSIFGYLSVTTGGLLAGMIHHPNGVISLETQTDQLVYHGMTAVFLLIGLRYLLIGILFPSPL